MASCLGWHHIALIGDYNWYSGAAERMDARPLNLYAKNPCVETPLTSFRGISDVFVPLRVILDTNLPMTPLRRYHRRPGPHRGLQLQPEAHNGTPATAIWTWARGTGRAQSDRLRRRKAKTRPPQPAGF